MKKIWRSILASLIVIGVVLLLIVIGKFTGVGESFLYPIMGYLLFGTWDSIRKKRIDTLILHVALLTSVIYSQL
jgi:hypothetical protein